MDHIDGLKRLREPFPPHAISKLPKPSKRQTDMVNDDYTKGIRCKLCGQWHHPDVVHLDYVGHAALTDRLLECDPLWNWEPVATDERGRPALDSAVGMWIKLTVCGHTRLGYGHAEGKKGGDAIKEAIGDALRNAAMRFGAALDLWHKGELRPAEPAEGDAVDPVEGEAVDPVEDDRPKFNPAAAADRIIGRLGKCETLQQARDVWTEEKDAVKALRDTSPEHFGRLSIRLVEVKAALANGPARQAPPLDDQIPY